MQISREHLSKHYALLSDAALLEINPDDLLDIAKECRALELRRRGLSNRTVQDQRPDRIGSQIDVRSDWLDTAGIACTLPAGRDPLSVERRHRVCEVLREAGIPCELADDESDEPGPRMLNVMVPGVLVLKAMSVLDRDLFNEELEESWCAHFDALSDDELATVSPDDICAGFLDRAARLRRVYEEALASRRISLPPA